MKRNWQVMVMLAVFLIIGTLYAVYTPRWQTPDEPAHYNYIRALAEERRFPIMSQGDYDQPYLSRLTTERFPPELPVDDIEYEDHQPPLYYLLMVPAFVISSGSVVVIRTFTVLLGAAAVMMAMLLLREAWPGQPGVVTLACGLLAFIPQFVAMMAAVNNDALMLTLLWLWLYLALRYLQDRTSTWVLGAVLGLILLTKTTGYGALPLAVLVVFLKHRQDAHGIKRGMRDLAAIFLPAILLGGMWWLRNIIVYGWPDFMGLIRHDEVVIGQPRTMTAVLRDGLFPFLISASRTTFQSFWGQFGWMGVVLDSRIYRGLLIFSFCALMGAVSHFVSEIKCARTLIKLNAMILLCVSVLITAGLFVGYNLTFIQHQGRYLFPALPMLAMAASLGLRRLLERKVAVTTSLILMLFIVAFSVMGIMTGDIQLWWIFLLGLAAAGIISAAFSPKPWHVLYGGGLVTVLAFLDIVCLFVFIVPMLT